MRTIFASYSREDSDVVNELVDRLNEAGYQAWHDRALTGGQAWWDSILEEIRRRQIFLFAISRHSGKSEACRKELEYARALGRAIVPVRVDADFSLQLLVKPLTDLQVVDYLQPERDLLRVIAAINRLPERMPLGDPQVEKPTLPVSYVGGINEQLHSHDPLTDAEQKSLCTDLRIALAEGHARSEIRHAIEAFKKRPELLATVQTQLDALLREIDAPSGSDAGNPASGGGDVTHKIPATPKHRPQAANGRPELDPDAAGCVPLVMLVILMAICYYAIRWYLGK